MFCLLHAGIGSEEETVHDSTPDALEGGIRFGVYEIDCHADGSLCELGRGAMGVTYRATDTSLQRKVALKIIKTDIAERSADARERFVREARAAAALRHENIAVIHHFGMRLETGQYFYAMELIQGETLDERVRRAGPLDARSIIGIGEQVTSALAAAEKHGLVHRDLKPANLMLINADEPDSATSDQGRSKRSRIRALRKSGIPVVKIIDFGLAKALHSATDLKSLTHDRFIGTPAFASPEQIEHSRLDVRSDIYSLGETLWFALTGKTPFAGRTLSEIHRAQKSNALPVDQLKAAHVPHRLKSLLESMLAFEPASRPGTKELAARLQRCSPEVRSVRRARVALAIASLVVLGMSALFLFQPLGIQNAPVKPVPEKSIAVLPFENLSADQENAFFADGMQDEILTDLAKVADLKVISRTSVMAYKNRGKRNLREIANVLGVAHVVEGSVQRAGNRVRVSAQLIDARTDMHVWAERYDRDLADVFALESDLAEKIVTQLKSTLSPEQKTAIEARPTNDLGAYNDYVHAKNLIANAVFNEPRKASLLEAIDLLQKAVLRDPAFALAYYQLAHAHDQMYLLEFDHTSERLELANAAIEALERLQPDSGEAHLGKAKHLYWGYRDYEGARRELGAAKRMLPNDPQLFLLTGYIERRQGHWTEAIQNLEHAVRLDPQNPFTLQQSSLTFELLRRYGDVASLLDRALAIRPNDVSLRLQRAWVDANARADTKPLHAVIQDILKTQSDSISRVADQWLRLALWERDMDAASRALSLLPPDGCHGDAPFPHAWCEGRVAQLLGQTASARECFSRARKEIDSVLRVQSGYAQAFCAAGVIDAMLGNQKEAIEEGQSSVRLLPVSKDAVDGAQMIQLFAATCGWAGQKDLAFEQLARASAIPGYLSYGSLRLDPLWDPVRGDPRFDKIVVSLAPKD